MKEAQKDMKLTRSTHSEDGTTSHETRTGWEMLHRCVQRVNAICTDVECQEVCDSRALSTMNNEHRHRLMRIHEEMPNLPTLHIDGHGAP
jgi:hypothetical protein